MRFTTIAAIVVCAINTSVLDAGAEKARAKAGVASKAVTITGCIERHEDAFRVTRASGAQVPTSRSWKSGFLKKRPADVSVVDASRKIRLKDHVGHRDALTGTIENGGMRVQSMRHLAAGCGN
jgi:hypothetical protein